MCFSLCCGHDSHRKPESGTFEWLLQTFINRIQHHQSLIPGLYNAPRLFPHICREEASMLFQGFLGHWFFTRKEKSVERQTGSFVSLWRPPSLSLNLRIAAGISRVRPKSLLVCILLQRKYRKARGSFWPEQLTALEARPEDSTGSATTAFLFPCFCLTLNWLEDFRKPG